MVLGFFSDMLKSNIVSSELFSDNSKQVIASSDSNDFFVTPKQLQGYVAYYTDAILEKVILSMTIIEPKTLWWAASLRDIHFFDYRNQKIFKIISVLRAQKKEVNEEIIISLLSQDDQ
jgi:hypothetical protein